MRLDDATISLAVVYCYPRTGRPDANALGGTERWNAIPGARGCTPQSCGYRDHHPDLELLGARVYGLSTQTTEYQREAVSRLIMAGGEVSRFHDPARPYLHREDVEIALDIDRYDFAIRVRIEDGRPVARVERR